MIHCQNYWLIQVQIYFKAWLYPATEFMPLPVAQRYFSGSEKNVFDMCGGLGEC